MEEGFITVNKDYMIFYRYHKRDPKYRYFNRKFEIALFKKDNAKSKLLLLLLLDNCDTGPGKWFPHIHKPGVDKKYYLGISTLNWNQLKNKLLECFVSETKEDYREDFKKAVDKLLSPKLS